MKQLGPACVRGNALLFHRSQEQHMRADFVKFPDAHFPDAERLGGYAEGETAATAWPEKARSPNRCWRADGVCQVRRQCPDMRTARLLAPFSATAASGGRRGWCCAAPSKTTGNPWVRLSPLGTGWRILHAPPTRAPRGAGRCRRHGWRGGPRKSSESCTDSFAVAARHAALPADNKDAGWQTARTDSQNHPLRTGRIDGLRVRWSAPGCKWITPSSRCGERRSCM